MKRSAALIAAVAASKKAPNPTKNRRNPPQTAAIRRNPPLIKFWRESPQPLLLSHPPFAEFVRRGISLNHENISNWRKGSGSLPSCVPAPAPIENPKSKIENSLHSPGVNRTYLELLKVINFFREPLPHFPPLQSDQMPTNHCLSLPFLHLAGVEPLTAEEIRRAVQAALRGHRQRGCDHPGHRARAQAQANAVMRAREPLVVAGLALAEAAFRELSPAAQSRAVARTASAWRRARPCCASPARPAPCCSAERVALNFVQRLCRHRHSDRPVRRGRQRHARADSRHAQNHARLAAAGKIRRRLRRRPQPSHRPVRHGAHQGQPPGAAEERGAQRHCRRRPARARELSRASRWRSKPTRWSRSSRRSRRGPTSSCSTT